MINFIKILPYELYPSGLSKAAIFSYVCGVLNQQIDPPSLAKNKLELNAGTILLSPLRRSQECLKKNPNARSEIRPELKEIPFNLAVPQSQWEKEGSKLVRERFIQLFIADELLISRKKIFTEIKLVLKHCNDPKIKQPVAVLSHSFRLKIFEAFLKTNGRIETQPALIQDYLKPNQKTFAFGTGFNWEA